MKVFNRRPYLTKETGHFKFDFYYAEGKLDGTYLQISTTSGIWGMRIAGNCHAYGYLLAAAKQDFMEQLQGYAVTLLIPAMELTQDQDLCNDIQGAIMEWQKRKEKEAETAAKSVTEAEEQANQALMEVVVSGHSMSKRELKAKRKADKEAMREVLNELADEKVKENS